MENGSISSRILRSSDSGGCPILRCVLPRLFETWGVRLWFDDSQVQMEPIPFAPDLLDSRRSWRRAEVFVLGDRPSQQSIRGALPRARCLSNSQHAFHSVFDSPVDILLV